MTEVTWNPNAWDTVVMNEKEKLVLRSLVLFDQTSCLFVFIYVGLGRHLGRAYNPLYAR